MRAFLLIGLSLDFKENLSQLGWFFLWKQLEMFNLEYIHYFDPNDLLTLPSSSTLLFKHFSWVFSFFIFLLNFFSFFLNKKFIQVKSGMVWKCFYRKNLDKITHTHAQYVTTHQSQILYIVVLLLIPFRFYFFCVLK